MTTRAFLLIKATDARQAGGRKRLMAELRGLPEVKYVEPVSGLYDCVARVEGRQSLIAAVHKVMSRSRIEYMEVLAVEGAEVAAGQPGRLPKAGNGRKG